MGFLTCLDTATSLCDKGPTQVIHQVAQQSQKSLVEKTLQIAGKLHMRLAWEVGKALWMWLHYLWKKKSSCNWYVSRNSTSLHLPQLLTPTPFSYISDFSIVPNCICLNLPVRSWFNWEAINFHEPGEEIIDGVLKYFLHIDYYQCLELFPSCTQQQHLENYIPTAVLNKISLIVYKNNNCIIFHYLFYVDHWS